MASIGELLEEYKFTNIEETDENGNTLAHLVIKNEKFTQKEMTKILEILLDVGVDPDVENRNNETVLHLAIEKRMKDVVDILLRRQVNIDSAIHFLIEDEYLKFKELSEQFNEQDSEVQKIETESIDFIEFLVSKGLDFGCKNERGLIPLCMAFNFNLQHILPVLLQSTKNFQVVDCMNETLLHLFFKRSYSIIQDFIDKNWYSKKYVKIDILRILLDAGLSVDAKNNNYRTPIEMAIDYNEDIEIVEILLERTNVNCKMTRGWTLFQSVIRYWVWSQEANDDYFMKIALNLIAKGADINESDVHGHTPLWYPIESHNLRILEFLRDNGANFNVTTKDGETVMHQFVKTFCMNFDENVADKSILDLLLEHSTNFNVHHKNSKGETLFHMVIMKWARTMDIKSDTCMKIAQVLIAKGANVSEPNEYGWTPLWYAIQSHNLHVVEFLRKNGADFMVITKNALLHLLIETSFYMKSVEDEAEMTLFDLLLEYVTDVNHKNSEGETVFYSVISKWARSKDTKTEYYAEISRALIAKGANVNDPDKHKMTPVGCAVEKHNLCVVEFLRENGANFSVTMKDGGNLMHHLIDSSDHVKMCDIEIEIRLFDLLLECLTNIHHKNVEGQTVFHKSIKKWATSKEANTDYYLKIGHALITRGADVNEPDKNGQIPLFHAIKGHSSWAAKFLIENGADCNITTEDGGNIMHLLVNNREYMKTGNDEVKVNLLKLLISKGFGVNVRDKNGTTPLHVAAMKSNAHVVRMLIRHGAQVNCRNNKMETPLHFATKNPEVEMVARCLLEQGAHVNAQDSDGRTALHKIAVEPVSHYSCIGLWILFEYGADVKAKDQKNQSALRCAQKRNFQDYLKKCQQYVQVQNDSLCGKYYENYKNIPLYYRNLYQDDGPDQITIDDCPLEEMASSVIICLTELSIKLKAANLLWDKKIENWHRDFTWDQSIDDFYKYHYEKCMQEIEKLKSTHLDNHVTLYDLLHLNLNGKCVYINNETLQQLVHSSELDKQFPEYKVVLLASYHEAVTRKKLIESAKQAWLELTEIALPDLCIELILSFLSNSDLFIITEKD